MAEHKEDTSNTNTNSANGVDVGKMVQELLDKLHVNTNPTSTSTSITNGNKLHTKESLQAAQVQLQHLQAIQDLLTRKLEAQESQVKELQIHVSPFEAFEEDLVNHFVTFLNEESLLAMEQVMPQWTHLESIRQQWKQLDKLRPFSSNAIELTSRERGIRFVLASQYAKKMEKSAMYHYNPRQYITKQYEWPERLYTREDFQNDFDGYDNGDEPPPNLEFFVRLSYRTAEDDEAPTKVLTEGFMSDYSDLDPWDKDQYTIIELGKDNTHVHMVCNNLNLLDLPENMGINIYNNWRLKQVIEWPVFEMKAYMKRISLTVLACEPHQKTGHSNTQLLQSHLVVATRGFHSNKELLAIMPPRSYLSKARTANLLDCVNTAIKPTEEQKGKIGFRIMIDWGTQDVFTRRKSIMDHFNG